MKLNHLSFALVLFAIGASPAFAGTQGLDDIKVFSCRAELDERSKDNIDNLSEANALEQSLVLNIPASTELRAKELYLSRIAVGANSAKTIFVAFNHNRIPQTVTLESIRCQ